MCPVVLKSSRPWHIISFTSDKCKTSLCAWYQYDQLIFLISLIYQVQFSSVTQLCLTLPPHRLQQARLPCPSPTPRAYPNSSTESVMPSNHLILCCPLLLLPSIFPSIRVFCNESVLHIRWPNYWVSALTSVLPMNIQDWFPLGWTGCISLQSKGLSRVFSNTTVQRNQFSGTQLSLQSNFTSIHDYWKNHGFD